MSEGRRVLAGVSAAMSLYALVVIAPILLKTEPVLTIYLALVLLTNTVREFYRLTWRLQP